MSVNVASGWPLVLRARRGGMASGYVYSMVGKHQARMSELGKALDAFIWSAICYLDSPSDYREYLPYPRQPSSIQDSKLVMLDEIPRHVRAWLWGITLFVVVLSLILAPLLRTNF